MSSVSDPDSLSPDTGSIILGWIPPIMVRFRIQGLDDQKFQKFKIRIRVQSGSGSETPVMCQHIIFISMSQQISKYKKISM